MRFLILLLLTTSAFAQRTKTITEDCLRIQDGICIDKDELGYIDGAASNIQDQITGIDLATSEIDNTADLDKPISTATQTALDLKANDNAVIHLTGDESASGVKTFTGKIVSSSTTNGSHPCPTMTDTEMLTIASPVAGDCVYNSTLEALHVYNATDTLWELSGSGGGISAWVTATAYDIGDVVIESNKIYKANTGHTSGTFATDIANWTQLANNVSDSTGVLPMANGGTDKNLTPVLGGVVYTDAGSMEVLAAGTSGQVLKSNAGAAPTWGSLDVSTHATGTLAVANGGTGAATLTANNVLLGNGTSAVQVVAPGTNGNALISNGTTWTSAAVGTGTSQVLAPGVTSPKVCYYAFGGTSATLASPTECASGTCVEVYDSCGTVTPPSFSATGFYENTTFASGTWANSTPVMCKCSAFDATTGIIRFCNPTFVSGDNTWSSTASGGYIGNNYSTDTAGGAQNSYIFMECSGRAP